MAIATMPKALVIITTATPRPAIPKRRGLGCLKYRATSRRANGKRHSARLCGPSPQKTMFRKRRNPHTVPRSSAMRGIAAAGEMSDQSSAAAKLGANRPDTSLANRNRKTGPSEYANAITK